jgi:hypothetical protein
MFGWGPATKVYLAAGATDMRKYAPSIVMWSRMKEGSKHLGGHHWVTAANCT